MRKMRKTVSYINLNDVLNALGSTEKEREQVTREFEDALFVDAEMTLINTEYALDIIVTGYTRAYYNHVYPAAVEFDDVPLCKKFWTIVAKDDYINLEP